MTIEAKKELITSFLEDIETKPHWTFQDALEHLISEHQEMNIRDLRTIFKCAMRIYFMPSRRKV
jgi:hypothetical protein